MVSTVRVNADDGRDCHHLADHMTQLRNFTKSVFSVSVFTLINV